MALATRRYARANAPHLASLVGTLTPLFPAGQGVHLHYEHGELVVEAENWTGVVDATVQTAVTAAPADTPVLQAQTDVDELSLALRAVVLVLVDELNRLRTTPVAVFPAITPAQAWTAIKAKAQTIAP